MTAGLRKCHSCGETKHFPDAFRDQSRTCLPCAAAIRRDKREKVSQTLRARRGNPDLFTSSLVKLEAVWGPFAKWTREQHCAHTALLCRAVGIDDAVAHVETRGRPRSVESAA